MSVPTEDSIKSVLDFLYKHEFYKAFIALEQESSVRLHSYGKELDFLYTLIVEGRYDDAEKFIFPLKSRSEEDYNASICHLRKQHFLEAIENSEAPELQELVTLLKDIEKLSSKEEFNTLCHCLSLSKITDHPDYASWSIWRGRIQCFQECLKSLNLVYPIEEIAKPTYALEEVIGEELKFEESSRRDTDLMDRFDPDELTEIASISDAAPIRACCFDTQGDYFMLGTNSKTIKICSLQSIAESLVGGGPTAQAIDTIFEMRNLHFGSVYCVDWSHNGRLFATGSNDKAVKVIRTPDLARLQSENSSTVIYSEGRYIRGSGAHIQDRTLKGHQGTVRAVCFHPYEEHILASGGIVDASLKLWNTETGQCIQSLQGHSGSIFGIATGESCFLSVGTDKKLRVWDIRSQSLSLTLNCEDMAGMNSVCNEKKNSTAVGHCDGAISLWDLRAGKLFNTFAYHSADCRSVDFSSNGQWLLSGSFDSALGMVDLSEDQIYKLEPNMDRIVSAKWHPVLPIVLSTAADKTARIFAKHGRC